tara:strand:+ start:101 stop:1165 length:1065 start_codon:yes stop_codon:yes gene_type:complete
MKLFNGRSFPSINGGEYDTTWKVSARQHNAKIVADGIEVCWCDLDIENRTHQSRVKDIAKGHINDLANDIGNSGLQILPTVEWDNKKNKFVVLGGHHRLSAINHLKNKREKVWQGEFPVAVLEFKKESDRIKYLASDNAHKPVRGHSQADASRFLSQLHGQGEFDNCPDESSRKKLAYELLTQYFPTVYGTAKNKVYEDAFKPQKAFKNWQTKEIADEKASLWNIAPKQQTAGNTAYVHGNNTQWGNSLSNRMNEHLNNLQNGTTKAKLKVKLMAHVQIGNQKASTLLNTVVKQRSKILEQAKLKNVWVYGPAGVACVDEIVFLPQILSPKNVAESDPLIYNWDSFAKEFKEAA